MNATTTQRENEVVISRSINAPRAAVFKAWTDQKQLQQWFGPQGFTNPICEIDVRPGGAFRIVMKAPDGGEFPAVGVYGEIVPPERLVMIFDHSELPEEWHDQMNPNRARGKARPKLEAHTTVTFEQVGSGTKVTIRVRFESPAIRDAFVKIGMQEGWGGSLDRLEALVAKK